MQLTIHFFTDMDVQWCRLRCVTNKKLDAPQWCWSSTYLQRTLKITAFERWKKFSTIPGHLSFPLLPLLFLKYGWISFFELFNGFFYFLFYIQEMQLFSTVNIILIHRQGPILSTKKQCHTCDCSSTLEISQGFKTSNMIYFHITRLFILTKDALISQSQRSLKSNYIDF